MLKLEALLTQQEFTDLRQGSPLVFRKVYDAYYGLVHYVADRCGLTGTESRDVVQDTFIKLHIKSAELQNAETIKAWLVTTARNRSLDLLRQKKTEQKKINRQLLDKDGTLELEDSSHQTIWHELQVNLVKELIIDVCEKSGDDSFKLFYVDGLSANEIAERKGEPVSTVTNRLSRLRNRFRDHFKQHLEQIPANAL